MAGGGRVGLVIDRPAHLAARPVTGRLHNQPLTIITPTTTRDSTGRGTVTEAQRTTSGATAPPSQRAARVRELMEGGVQLNAMRHFWVTVPVNPVLDPHGETPGSPGDLILWDGQRWRVDSAQDWGRFTQVLAVREEGQ